MEIEWNRMGIEWNRMGIEWNRMELCKKLHSFLNGVFVQQTVCSRSNVCDLNKINDKSSFNCMVFFLTPFSLLQRPQSTNCVGATHSQP